MNKQKNKTHQCISCGNSEFSEPITGSGWSVKKCTHCGLGHTVPMPEPDKESYDEKYYIVYNEAFDKKRFDQVLSLIETRKKRGSILDIGCGAGVFLTQAKKRGWDVTGHDFSPYVENEVSRKKGIPIYSCPLDDPQFQKKTFDVITLNHVLEHVPAPIFFLGKVRPLIKDGGLLYIELPNFSSSEALRVGPFWEDLRPEQHIHHFSPLALQNILGKGGFETLSTETRRTPFWHFFESGHYLSRLRAPKKNTSATIKDMAAMPPQISPNAGQKKSLFRRIVVQTLNATSRFLLAPLIKNEEKKHLAKRLMVFAHKSPLGK